jgi:hypothetical protein
MKAKKYETVIPEKDIKFTWCEDMSLDELLNNRDDIMTQELPEIKSTKTGGVLKLCDILADIY